MSYTNRQIEMMESAGKILTDLGVSKLTIKNIAKEMNFVESAVYRHFSSKEDIIISMLNYLSIEMDERYSTLINSKNNPIENLEIIFISQIDFFIQKPFFVGAIFPDGFIGESDNINNAVLNLMDTRRKHLIPILEQCIKNNIVTDDLTSDEISHILMGSFRLLIFKWRTSKFSFDLSLKGQKLLSNILKLITK